MYYHSMVLLFKVKTEKTPKKIYKHIGGKPVSNTRHEIHRVQNHLLKDARNFKTEIGRKSFIPRAIDGWNSLPTNLRRIDSLQTFKKELKIWINSSIPVK